MLSVVKYHQLHKPPKQKTNKKFLYKEDYDFVKEWLDDYGIGSKTIDCEIMDLSDEIAYAVHDLEDALKLKYFTIDELLHEFSISVEFKEITSEFQKIVKKSKDFASKSNVYETSEEYSMLFRKELSSILTSKLIRDIGVTSNKLDFLTLGKLANGFKETNI